MSGGVPAPSGKALFHGGGTNVWGKLLPGGDFALAFVSNQDVPTDVTCDAACFDKIFAGGVWPPQNSSCGAADFPRDLGDVQCIGLTQAPDWAQNDAGLCADIGSLPLPARCFHVSGVRHTDHVNISLSSPPTFFLVFVGVFCFVFWCGCWPGSQGCAACEDAGASCETWQYCAAGKDCADKTKFPDSTQGCYLGAMSNCHNTTSGKHHRPASPPALSPPATFLACSHLSALRVLSSRLSAFSRL